VHPQIQEISTQHAPESLARTLLGEPGLVLLRSQFFDSPHARYSFVAVRPFLQFKAFGARCTVGSHELYGNPWNLLDALIARYELLDQLDLPFPLGGCFGYWGYDLKQFVESRLEQHAVNDLELPILHVGFYDSLVVFDHRLERTWIVSTGLTPDGTRDPNALHEKMEFWRDCTARSPRREEGESASLPRRLRGVGANISRDDFIRKVQRIQEYIRLGHIYQANLAQRLAVQSGLDGWNLYQRLSGVSPAPFSAYYDCGEFQLVSSSPELFLRLSGNQIQTRPIKGTRPRSPDSLRDAQLTYELQTSAKEISELVMITDLLRNDLGRVCEYGSVHVPDLLRLERYPQVQHLVSTVEGRLRPGVTHLSALMNCFPGGSVTGAPKIRAMEIIDELEPVTRGPYTGCLGYLGFNRESQLSILIRTAICKDGWNYFHAGAGIVADSDPEAEYEETMVKAEGFLRAVSTTHERAPTRLSPARAAH
jgi:para-aminobenzoate synthetase component 1